MPNCSYTYVVFAKLPLRDSDRAEKITGSRKFTYVTAVTVLKGDRQKWENYKPFLKAMERNPIRIITLNEILDEVYAELKDLGTTLASTEVGRVLQVIKASKWMPQKKR